MRVKQFELNKILDVSSLTHMFKNIFFANQYNPEHKSNHWEMLFVESGEVMASTPRGELPVSAGQAIFHAPNELHRHYNSSKKNAVIIDITFSTDSQYIQNLDGKLLTLSGSDVIKLNELLNIAIIPETGDYPEESEVKQQYIKNNIELFLLELIYTHVQETIIDNPKKHYDIIMNVLYNNIYNPLKLSDIAKLCRLSESTVKQVFHTYHDEGIMTYFNKLKINEIKYHISNGVSINAISNSMSFSSQNYFSAFFKRETGMSPREYRNKHLK